MVFRPRLTSNSKAKGEAQTSLSNLKSPGAVCLRGEYALKMAR